MKCDFIFKLFTFEQISQFLKNLEMKTKIKV